MIREIALFEADLGENMRLFAQEVEGAAVRFTEVNPRTVERKECVVGETATPSGAATSFRPTTTFLANVTAFVVKREIFDIGIDSLPLQLL